MTAKPLARSSRIGMNDSADRLVCRMNSPISTSPRMSVLVLAVRGESGTNLTSAPSSTIPIGTLTKKIHRQDR
jgi:hypothetical protein